MCLILKSNIRSNLWDYGEINESIAEHFMKIVRTLDTLFLMIIPSMPLDFIYSIYIY